MWLSEVIMHFNYNKGVLFFNELFAVFQSVGFWWIEWKPMVSQSEPNRTDVTKFVHPFQNTSMCLNFACTFMTLNEKKVTKFQGKQKQLFFSVLSNLKNPVWVKLIAYFQVVNLDFPNWMYCNTALVRIDDIFYLTYLTNVNKCVRNTLPF